MRSGCWSRVAHQRPAQGKKLFPWADLAAPQRAHCLESHSPAKVNSVCRCERSPSDPKTDWQADPEKKGKGEKEGFGLAAQHAGGFFSRELGVEGCARRKRPGRWRFLGPA